MVKNKLKMNRLTRSQIKMTKNLLINSTYVIKESEMKEPSINISGKRLEMLKRRLNALLTEKRAWSKRNKGLSDSIEEEKKLNASLKSQIFSIRNLHKKAVVAKNLFKAQQNKVAQTMVACLQETNGAFPHLLGLSECITNNKIRAVKFLETFSFVDRESLKRISNANDKCAKIVNNKKRTSNVQKRHRSESFVDKPASKSPRTRRSCKKI